MTEWGGEDFQDIYPVFIMKEKSCKVPDAVRKLHEIMAELLPQHPGNTTRKKTKRSTF